MKMYFGREHFFLFGAIGAIKGFIFICCVFFVNWSYAAETGKQNNSVAQYKKLLAEQQKEFQLQRQIIAEQGKALEQLKLRLDALTNQGVEKQASNKPQIVAANNKPPSTSPNQLPSKPVGQAPPEATKKPRPPEIPRLSETVGGVLTRKGNIVFEPSIQYAYTSNNRVFLDAFTFLPAIAIGLIDLREVKRHSFIGTLGTRYGVTDRLEVEFRVPYVYRDDTQRSRPVSIGAGVDETFNATGNDIGDLEFAGRYQLTNGSNGWPILVGNIVATAPTGKSPFDVEYVQAQGVPGAAFPTELPTGAGYFSFQPSLTALYPTDPAVFFGNLSYSYNAETSTKFGKVNPGDALGLSFGMGFGINERSSYSLGYSHKHVLDSQINGITIKGSTLDIGQLLVGYSFKYSPKTTFNLSLGIGTTTDAQDVTLNFRMPMTFDFI
ncbi:MAG: transporter [Methylococcaceae bacterium]